MSPFEFLAGTLLIPESDPVRAPHVVVHLPGNIATEFARELEFNRDLTVERVRSIADAVFAARSHVVRISVAGSPGESLTFDREDRAPRHPPVRDA